mgnify:CR=1 FL=1
MLRKDKRMPTTQQLREQRANIWDQMKGIMDGASGRDLSAEESQKYDRLETDLDALGVDITRREKYDARAAEFSAIVEDAEPKAEVTEKGPKQSAYDKAFYAWLTGNETPEDRSVLRSGYDADAVKMAAGVGTGGAGGYTVAPQFRDKFVQVMKWFGPMLDEAEVITTETGANLQWPVNDDTANVGAILGENTQVSEQDITLTTNSLDAYMYTSKLVRASYQVIQDSEMDFEGWLTQRLGQRVGRILNNHFTVGTGTGQPDGIVTNATVGATSTGSFASTGGISYGSLVDLIESIDPAYGGADGLKFMGHQSARKAIRKIVDGQQRPIWEPSVQSGTPDLLLGYPFRVNNDMATMATSSKSLLFGNIKQAYVIRLITGVTTLKLVERYADFLQNAFLAFQRADGTLQDANAVKVHQTTATA